MSRCHDPNELRNRDILFLCGYKQGNPLTSLPHHVTLSFAILLNPNLFVNFLRSLSLSIPLSLIPLISLSLSKATIHTFIKAEYIYNYAKC